MAKGITVFVVNYQLNPAGIQFLVGFTTFLMVIRFGLDIYRHRSNSVTMRSTLLMLDTATYALLQFSLGVMQRPSMANSYYQVWAVLLVTLRYSVKHGRPAGVALRQTPLVDLMSSFWAANILRTRAPLMLKVPVWLLWSINSARIIHGFVSMEHATASHKDNMRLVAEYMRCEHDDLPSGDAVADPATMKGYRYLVRGEDKQEKKARHPRYRLELKLTRQEKLITLDKVWEWAHATAGGSDQEHISAHRKRVRALLNSRDGRLKDLCLSFALYKLLRRRFYNLPIHESKLVKTRRLVFYGILGQGSGNNKSDPSRAFRVTKAEISFLNDFFYSRHALLFANGFPLLRLLLSTLLVGAISYMAFAIHQYSKVAHLDELGRVRVHHGVVFTWILLSMLGAKEMIEVSGYVFSDWTKVMLVCNYATQQPRWFRGWMMEQIVRLLCKCSFIGKSWHGKMGQYNLIFGRGRRRNYLAPIDLTKEVQDSVLYSLGSLRNPSEESYLDKALSSVPLAAENFRKEVHEKVNALDGDVHRILLWHIATCYCELYLARNKGGVMRPWWVRVPWWVSKRLLLPLYFFLPQSLLVAILGPYRNMNRGIWTAPFVKKSNLGDIERPYLSASSLSQYCAHLLRLNPPLIPGNEILNKEVLNRVIWETNRTLRGCYSISATFARLQGLTHPENGDGTFSRNCKDEAANIQGMTEGPHSEGSPRKDEVNIQENTERTYSEGSPGKDEATNIQGMTGRPHSKGSPRKMKNETDKNTLLKMGSELGHILIEEILKDETGGNFEVLWEFLEKLWAGFLIHLAQSTRASHHKLYLRTGGELITHVWALLSHTGLVGDVEHGELGDTYISDPVP